MKLIFFDIDGTLIGEHRQVVPKSAKAAIAAARENGHICVVNTGRSYYLVGNWLPAQVDFDGYLCGCGTHILYRGQCLCHQTFVEDMAKEIIDGLERYGIDAVLEGSENNFHNDFAKMHTKVFHDYMKHFEKEHYGSYEQAPGRFDKFYCYAPQPGQMEGFQREFDERLDFIDRERGFYEIAPKGFSKASAMRYLAEHLGIPMEETVAIGDSNNDLQMLQCAHTAIAMGNANETVKAMADYVTTDVDDDGIRNALAWIGALGKDVP